MSTDPSDKARNTPGRYINNEGTRATFIYKDDDVLDKPLDFAQLRRLLTYMKPHKRLAVASILLMALTMAIRLSLPITIGLAIDKGISAGDLSYVLKTLAFLSCLYAALWLVSYIRIQMVNRLGQAVLTDLRQELFSHVQMLSTDFFDKKPAGSILVRITNDVDSLQELFTNGIIQMLVDMVAVVGISVIIFGLHPRLFFLSMSVLPLMVLASTGLRRLISRSWDWVRTTRTRINIHLNEALQGMKVTQAFVREDTNYSFFEAINGDHRRAWYQGSRVADTFGPILEFAGILGTCLVYWYGSILVGRGELTLGLMISFVQYLGSFWEPITRLGGVYNQMLQAMASSDRIFELLDTEPVVRDHPNCIVDRAIEGRVEFRNVSFRYTVDRKALDAIDLSIYPGQMVALVGHTGSGKTTIASLIQRTYDITDGQLLIDGINIREFGLECLRSQVGVVLQDTFLFSGSLRDNIKFGRLDATDEEAEDAAKAVMADDFIRRLPDGYDTVVHERGSGISIGQRQLISFARAILANPRILILDEATASIDTQTEVLIQKALSHLLKGRTSIVIAHRLSTIKQADMIAVLEHGKIVEQGDHGSLVRAGGRYSDLVNAQNAVA